MKNFLVYKSSAGSGKTTTLVKEYLKLTLRNPQLFNRILAITFTNKAANEMKSRIVETLRTIVAGKIENPVTAGVVAATGLNDASLFNNASYLLFLIDHHYDEFSVSTIDSFVHKIIRTFAADLQLPQNFEVVIDKEDFAPFIVDDIYKKTGFDANFTNILIRYVLSQVEDEKSYNITSTLESFVENQLKEDDFFSSAALEQLKSSDFIEIIKKLNKKRFELKKIIAETGQKAFDLIGSKGLVVDDFSNKTGNGAISYFRKARNFDRLPELAFVEPPKRAKEVFEDNKGWYSAKAPAQIIDKIEEIKPALTKCFETIRAVAADWLRYQAVFKNIYQVTLIHEIRSLFKEFIIRTQKVHISEFNKRIAAEIAGQPVPYLYERLGHRYSHFMVDEFQDTSVLQWNNLLPLIEESLANNRFNMIVGDAKQAIYRFRGGEVELFTHLPYLYTKEETIANTSVETLLVSNYDTKNLDVNYRSHNKIIEFNNRFFKVAKEALPDDLKVIYDNHEQKNPENEKPGGLVSFEIVRAKTAEEYRLAKRERILEIVKELKEQGYSWGDMAVLSLKNDDASDSAAALLAEDIPVVSSESVRLSGSPKVRFLVSFLRSLANEKDQVSKANVIKLLLDFKGEGDRFHQTASSVLHKSLSAVVKQLGFDPLNLNRLVQKPVYEICETLLRHFFGNNPSDIFTRFFLDFVFDKQQAHRGDIVTFLEIWNEKSEGLSINLPENTDAVQIMTVHKAKGLKFETVIADLENFDNREKLTKTQYWDDPGLQEVRPLEKTLLNIDKTLTVFNKEDVWLKEKGKTELDYLNLIYVAFTRPVRALFAIGNIDDKGKGKRFGEFLYKYLQSEGLWDNSQNRYQWGELPETAKKKETKGNEIQLDFVPGIVWEKHLSVAGPGEKIYAGKSLSVREYGTLIHDMLAEVTVSEDIPSVVRKFKRRGIISDVQAGQTETLLRKVTGHPRLSPLFSGNVRVKTETELYDAETGKFIRPDRVVEHERGLTVMEYKTGNPEESHKRQIKHYGMLLAKNGFTVSEMLLVYIGEDLNVTVEPVTD